MQSRIAAFPSRLKRLLRRFSPSTDARINMLKQTVTRKTEMCAVLQKRNELLKTKLANSRIDPRHVDPLRHNTREGMDSFFETIENESIYLEFGDALRRVAGEYRIGFDGRSVLDFGVGPGIALRRLLEGTSPARVVGHDFSENALVSARRQIPAGEFSRCDIYEGSNDRFDVVLCTEVLEHLTDPEGAMQTLLRMTNPAGVLILTVPDGRIDFSKFHINFWSPESWQQFIARTVGDWGECTAGTMRVRESAPYANNYAVLRRRVSP